ncbi:MAG TPA: M56 family metallopeptidase, partial [Candidatus Deferrimicrobium sp.]|nr:M56 family metallopeptidase [Candidatus Deferrimicrobium sp.]
LPANLSSGGNIVSPPPPAKRLSFNWETAAFVWLAGVLAILSYISIVNAFLFLKFRKYQICTDDNIAKILDDCRLSLHVLAKVSVIYDDSFRSPALFGLFRPKIVISPKVITLLPPQELRYVFLHELSHLTRRDLFVNILVTLIQVIYWFNPVILFAIHRMKQDCEMACDATALAAIKPEEHKKYGQTIIGMLQLLSESHWVPGTLGFANKINTRRIIMISTYKKTTLKWALAALAFTLIVGCSSLGNPIKPISNSQNPKDTTPTVQQGSATDSQQNTDANTTTPSTSSSSTAANSIVYQNTQYGFSFALPESWKGYSIQSSPWQGLAMTGQNGETIVETGTIVSIRNPKWTSKNPRQDIPIMVFSIGQWNSLQQGVFHIGAAPVGPSELGRNNSYVFALPARYNFAFLPGYEEVETILGSHPVHTTPVTLQHPDAMESLLFNIVGFAEQGKVLTSDFAVKTNTIEDIEKVWGKADKTDYIALASGRFATYSSHNIVFGINKGDQIFEIRSYDGQLKGITLAGAKKVLGTPAYDAKVNGQEIIGFTTNSEFRVEMVFSQPTNTNPNSVMDHYNVLYPNGTVNSMAGNPGRQW